MVSEPQRLAGRAVGPFVLGGQTVDLSLKLLLVGDDDGRPLGEPGMVGASLGQCLGQLDLRVGPLVVRVLGLGAEIAPPADEGAPHRRSSGAVFGHHGRHGRARPGPPGMAWTTLLDAPAGSPL